MDGSHRTAGGCCSGQTSGSVPCVRTQAARPRLRALASWRATFTPLDWNVARTVTVTGRDDFAFDGPASYTIALAPAVSADPAYSGLDAADVALTNADNETPGITVTRHRRHPASPSPEEVLEPTRPARPGSAAGSCRSSPNAG